MNKQDYEGWPTTRRYPRTLIEAFPDDVENGEWFYPPEQRWQDKLFLVGNVCLWVALAFYFVKD